MAPKGDIAWKTMSVCTQQCMAVFWVRKRYTTYDMWMLIYRWNCWSRFASLTCRTNGAIRRVLLLDYGHAVNLLVMMRCENLHEPMIMLIEILCTYVRDNYTISYQHTLYQWWSILIYPNDLLVCAVCAVRPFAGGTWTKSFMSRLCSCTGSALVKKSARLSTPLRHITRNCPWRIRSRIQWNFISILFVRLGLTVSVAIPCAHLLSHSMIVAGCGYPSAFNICLSEAPSCPFKKSAAYSASATDATTAGMIELMVWSWKWRKGVEGRLA